MNPGTLVTSAWTYYKKKIISDSGWIGLIVSPDIEYRLVEIEKIKKVHGEWEVEILEDFTEVILVFSDGDIEYFPVCNLIKMD